MLIVDDVQAGNGRTGTFFSFEPAGIKTDIVCMSKAIGGYGLPMAITLIKPGHDIWSPAEHNGTFRGNNMALETATEALSFWENDEFSKDIQDKGEYVSDKLADLIVKYPELKGDRKSTRLNSSHVANSYAVFCLKKKKRKRIVQIEGIQLQTEVEETKKL